MVFELFLETLINGDQVCVPVSTAIHLFVLKFSWYGDLNEIPINIYFVNTANCLEKASSVSHICRVPLKCFPKAHILDWKDLPISITRCILPAFTSYDGRLVHSGLCSTLRAVVLQIDKEQPHSKIGEILGFRRMCLKSCAEVSVWTRFCELQVPDLLSAITSQKKRLESKSPNQELLHFEKHLSRPAVIPNINKRKRKLQQTRHFAKAAEQADVNYKKDCIHPDANSKEAVNICENIYREVNLFERKQSSSELDGAKDGQNDGSSVHKELTLPGLDHWFAEGADLTLTDLILFPCIALILGKYVTDGVSLDSLSKVCAWYRRLKQCSRIQSTLEFLKLDAPCIELTIQTEQSKKDYSQEEKDNKLLKTKVKVNTADALPIIDKLRDAGVNLGQEQYPCEGEKLTWDTLPAAVHPQQGSLPDKRIGKKCEQLENLALTVKSIAKPGDVIVDFCAGGGHLGIVIAHLLPQCEVLLVENKQESIRRAIDRIQNAGIKNATLYQSNLDYFTGTFDIGTCLHACGVATDLVLSKCHDVNASFVVCPCCYGAIQEVGSVRYPRSQMYNGIGLSYQDYLSISRAADDQISGKAFMNAVDRDRVESFREEGYSVTLCSLHPLTCSPKNNLLIGVKNSDTN